MAEHRPVSADRVPTLTDVLQGVAVTADSALAAVPAAPAAQAFDGPVSTLELLASIQVHLDTLFQAHLREAIAPALARAVDGLLRELGPELALALRDIADRAVAQELARRSRRP